MATYIILGNFTEQGVRAVRDTTETRRGPAWDGEQGRGDREGDLLDPRGVRRRADRRRAGRGVHHRTRPEHRRSATSGREPSERSAPTRWAASSAG